MYIYTVYTRSFSGQVAKRNNLTMFVKCLVAFWFLFWNQLRKGSLLKQLILLEGCLSRPRTDFAPALSVTSFTSNFAPAVARILSEPAGCGNAGSGPEPDAQVPRSSMPFPLQPWLGAQAPFGRRCSFWKGHLCTSFFVVGVAVAVGFRITCAPLEGNV